MNGDVDATTVDLRTGNNKRLEFEVDQPIRTILGTDAQFRREDNGQPRSATVRPSGTNVTGTPAAGSWVYG